MDIATLIGLLAGLGVIVTAIFLGGDFGSFINIPSLLIVFGGTASATLIKFTLSDVAGAFKIGASIAFKNTVSDPQQLVDQAVELATIVRQKGLLGLESVTIENEFFNKGIRMCLDGHNIDVVKETVTREVNLTILRQETGETMFRGIGDSAPAFGMLGTLVGLVQMLANLDDPSTIGPAMAVAMLTTFYGALIANLMALPIADKLSFKTTKDKQTFDLIVDAIIQIGSSQNPNVLREMLSVYLPAGGSGGGDEGGDDKKKKKKK